MNAAYDLLRRRQESGEAVRLVLTEAELHKAYGIAHARREHDRLRGFKPTYGASTENSEALMKDKVGALGECALAKYLDYPWDGALGNLAVEDVGPHAVRATTHAHGRLILHPKDDDAVAFTLALVKLPERKLINPEKDIYEVTSLPRVLLAGWMYARDGKQERYWWDLDGPKSAFFVPVAALRPMHTLKAITPPPP